MARDLALLCRRHHRAVHDGGFTIVQRADGMPVFVRPDGTGVETAPAMPRWHHEDADPVAPTAALLTAASAAIGPYTATARGDGAPFNVTWAIDVLRDSVLANPADHDCKQR